MRATRLPRLHVITDTRGPVASTANAPRSDPAAAHRDPARGLGDAALPTHSALGGDDRDRALDRKSPDTAMLLDRATEAAPPAPARGAIAPSELIVAQQDPLDASHAGPTASIGSPPQTSALHDPLAAIEAALAAGARLVQVRPEDHYTDRAAFDLATAITALCDQYGALCLVNDRVHIAEAIGADGVHLGADDLPIDAARRILPAASIIGGTARDPETARAARRAGATYLGVGPVWGTTTKAGLPQPIGLEGLAAVCEAVDLPVIAIGGITAERAALCREAGAHGVAVVGAISAAADPRQATEELLEAVGESPAEWRGRGSSRSGIHGAAGGAEDRVRHPTEAADADPRGADAASGSGLLRVAGEA